MSDNIIKIIKNKSKEIFPKEVVQKGNSRVFIDDNGYFFTIIEFQPTTLYKGCFLNVGVHFLFNKYEYIAFSYSEDNNIRVGKKFIKYIDDEQFANDILEYINLANIYIEKYRKLKNLEYAKNILIKSKMSLYEKAAICFLAEDEKLGNEYLKEYIESRKLKGMDCSEIKMSKNILENIIKEKREFWIKKHLIKE